MPSRISLSTLLCPRPAPPFLPSLSAVPSSLPYRLPAPKSLRSAKQLRHSSGSPNTSGKPSNYFNKTGEKEDSDPTKIHLRSSEYSQSGGDDVVAEQVVAAYKKPRTTDPASEKVTAGIGNVINPLEISPASPELSRTLNEEIVESGVEKVTVSKKGVGRKGKKVEKVEIDFEKMKMTRK